MSILCTARNPMSHSVDSSELIVNLLVGITLKKKKKQQTVTF